MYIAALFLVGAALRVWAYSLRRRECETIEALTHRDAAGLQEPGVEGVTHLGDAGGPKKCVCVCVRVHVAFIVSSSRVY